MIGDRLRPTKAFVLGSHSSVLRPFYWAVLREEIHAAYLM